MNKTTNDLMRALNLKHKQQTRKQIEWCQQQIHQNEQKWRHLHQQQQVCQQTDYQQTDYQQMEWRHLRQLKTLKRQQRRLKQRLHKQHRQQRQHQQQAFRRQQEEGVRDKDVMSHTTAPTRSTTASLDLGGGYTELHLAANEGSAQMTQLLLDRGADINGTTLRGNFTALFMAANRGHTSVVSLLLRAGANADIASNTGFTPLVRSLCLGHHTCAQALLESGCDVNTVSSSGASALSVLMESMAPLRTTTNVHE